MASYYYLISSLPMLKSDGSIPINFESFLEQCKPNVSAATYESLCRPTDPSNQHPMLKEWGKFYNSLMDEMNYQRSVKLGKAYSAPTNRDSELVNTISAALSAKTPLAAEQMLLDLEFKRIDSMIGLHNFDEYFLFGYAIKLKLLQRLTIFNHDDGSQEFKALFTGVRNQILNNDFN